MSILQIFIIAVFGFISFRIGYNTGKVEGQTYVQFVLKILTDNGIDIKPILKKLEVESEE